MSTTTTLLSGASGQHAWSFAQLQDTGLFTNGHDPVYAYSVRAGVKYAAGITAPGAPSAATNSTGLTGVYLYRARWMDSITNTMSLPSASVSITLTNQGARITQPSSPPARATHWIIERTTSGGSKFYPLNKVYATPDGTAIATTTYDDSTSDNTLGQRQLLDTTQGAPTPMSFIFPNQNRIFGGGGARHQATVTVTNGSPTVTSTDGQFVANQVGQDFSYSGDATGVTYKIATWTNANSITLASNYAGSTATGVGWIAGPRDRMKWSEDGGAEYWGKQIATGLLSNDARVGDDGEPLMGGIGLGPAGVLLAKQTRMFMLSYTFDPGRDEGDGRLIPVPNRRGITGPKAIAYVAGRVYGIDAYGIWSMAPGGMPEPIDNPISYEWWRNALNWSSSYNWWIQWQPVNRLLYFGITLGTDTYPRNVFTLDLDSQKWVGTKYYPIQVTGGVQMPDSEGRLRSVFATATQGGAKSYFWADDIGTSTGAYPTTTPVVGTLTACTSTTMTVTGASWYTSGDGLKGVPFTLVRAATGTEESGVITANTSDTITHTALSGIAAVIGDSVRIGPIEGVIVTPRFDCEYPSRKKCFKTAWVWLKKKSACVSLKARVYYDGQLVQGTPDTDRLTINEDGESQLTANSSMTLDPTTGQVRYEIPLNNQWATDIQFEFFSSNAGAPWEVSKMKLVFDLDNQTQPAKGVRA